MDGRHLAQRIAQGALDLLSPPRCLVCHAMKTQPLCDQCHAELVALPEGSCERCGVGEARECRVCGWMGVLDWVRSAADYHGIGGAAVRNLKFQRAMQLAEPMAALMDEAPLPPRKIDFVIPVPIHWTRHAYRGFNQSELLAKRLSFGPVRLDALRRIRPTPPQARTGGTERKEQLKGAFVSVPVPGAGILLVDDVVTSGGTLEECATALKIAGAGWVGAITFCMQLGRDTVK